MSKFTKGEWKYLEVLYQVTAYPEQENFLGHDPQSWPIYSNGLLWQDITGELCGFDEEEIHANGRLIASAPKMYEFLKWYVEDNPTANTHPKTTQRVKELLAYIDGSEAGND